MPDGALRLLFIADPQIGCMATFSGVDDAAIERFRRRGMLVRHFEQTDSIDWDVARYADVIERANELAPDLLVIGGDMIDAISHPDQLEAFREVTARSDLPIHYVPGNHDACDDATVPTEASTAWYEATFGATHEAFTRELDGGGEATFISVNSTVLDQPRKLPGAFEAELGWLEDRLRERRPGPTIVFSHHPPFIDDPEETDNYWNLPLERRRPFLDLLVEHAVDLVLCGHRHRNDHATYQGVEIVTSSAAGFPLGRDAPGYRTVDIRGTGISHTYYRVAEPDWAAIGGPPDPEA